MTIDEILQERGKPEGRKDDADKVPLDLIDTTALLELGKVLQFGAKKYAPENWRSGISFRRLTAAALRHMLAFNDGQDRDEETELLHVAHAMCCMMFLVWMYYNRPDMDDRWKRENHG